MNTTQSTYFTRKAQHLDNTLEAMLDERAEILRRLAEIEVSESVVRLDATIAWAQSGAHTTYSIAWRDADNVRQDRTGLQIMDAGRLLVEITTADVNVRPVITDEATGEGYSDGPAVWSAYDLAKQGFDTLPEED